MAGEDFQGMLSLRRSPGYIFHGARCICGAIFEEMCHGEVPRE